MEGGERERKGQLRLVLGEFIVKDIRSFLQGHQASPAVLSSQSVHLGEIKSNWTSYAKKIVKIQLLCHTWHSLGKLGQI